MILKQERGKTACRVCYLYNLVLRLRLRAQIGFFHRHAAHKEMKLDSSEKVHAAS